VRIISGLITYLRTKDTKRTQLTRQTKLSDKRSDETGKIAPTN